MTLAALAALAAWSMRGAAEDLAALLSPGPRLADAEVDVVGPASTTVRMMSRCDEASRFTIYYIYYTLFILFA